MYNKKTILVTIIVVIIGCLIIVATSSNKNKTAEIDNNEQLNAREQMSYSVVKIKKDEVTDVAKFYPVMIDGVKMEVIAVRASDNTIRTAFNACQVCAASGRGFYVQEGRKLICQNCGNQFDIDEIEIVRGGCNPAPITSEEKIDDGEYIVIPTSTLKANIDLFQF